MKTRQCKLAAAGVAALATGGLSAATPQVEKATSVPPLQPLPMIISGRVQPVPATAHVGGFGPDEYRAQWPGTVFSAVFRGSEVYFSVGNNHEILHVVVDGGAAVVLRQPEVGAYRVAGLANTKHTIKVEVATESQDAPNTFGGMGVPAGEKPLVPVRPKRQIEFIGDSHTVGYGNTSPRAECTTDEVWANTDDTQSFGALTAAHFGAAYQVNAISGRGIVRNYNGFPGATLPEAYPYALLDKKGTYHDPAWKPEVIVLALGTNDFSTALKPDERWKTREELHADYEASYLRFLETLHARNPRAYIIVWATGLAGGEIESEVGKVVEKARNKGITRLSYLPFDHLQFSGCHGHPSLADDRAIADRLIAEIDAQRGVCTGSEAGEASADT